ncbi:MAG: N-acetylmuramoyl-L-alanine amidase, partial [Flammeovirgaceae bacterium]|nr:N-acetylmuramoyl-L-alanine amidase [Flammeovirgaceae bacterium]
MAKSKFLWLLDNGHGGIINGKYQTRGKRSPKLKKPWGQLFEGEFNRAIVSRVIEKAYYFGIRTANICPEEEDISLSKRVLRANDWHEEEKCILVSVHANAGGGSGIEVFTTPGETKSDKIATVFIEKMAEEFPEAKFRMDLSDGDPDKESPFFIIRHTRMPAILVENFFMDNEEECKKYLLTREGRDRIVDSYIKAMIQVEKG